MLVWRQMAWDRRAVLVFAVLLAFGCDSQARTIGPISLDFDAGIAPRDADDPSMLPDTGIDETMLRVARVAPDHGPFLGGNVAVIRGGGFTDEAEVLVGGRAVDAADTELIDPRRLQIVLPPGEPGPVDVLVRIADVEVTAEDAYVYDAIAVEPSRGSTAGGTLLRIRSNTPSFVEETTVVVGASACTPVVMVSPVEITCRTAAAAPSTVDVTVQSPDVDDVTVEDAFTYYDASDPSGGGLGGGPLAGTLNVTVLNDFTGDVVPDAFVLVGEDLSTELQGETDVMGRITFSGPDLVGPATVHVAKHCFEKTSIVAFDATDVTVFLAPLLLPECADELPPGGGGGGGVGRSGAFISGELVWVTDPGAPSTGPIEWLLVPEPRANEIKVTYVFTTQRCAGDGAGCRNPDPAIGGAHRVLETDVGERGNPYRIFARPSALAVYALAGLENTRTDEFTPFVMGVARNVFVAPGQQLTDVDIQMYIPLDHTLSVRLEGLPARVGDAPDRFRVSADIDLGGEGFIVRRVNDVLMDTVRGRTADAPFRIWAQPPLVGPLGTASYRVEAGWLSGTRETQPYTLVLRHAVRAFDDQVVMDGFLGIPSATAPVEGAALPADRVLRWEADGPAPDLHLVLLQGGDGNPAWRHFVPGNVREAPIPDLSSIPELDDVAEGYLSWVVYAVRIPGLRFNELSYGDLQQRNWSAYASNVHTAQR